MVDDPKSDIANEIVKDNKKLVLDLIKNDPKITIKDISIQLSVAKSKVNRSISKLKIWELFQ